MRQFSAISPLPAISDTEDRPAPPPLHALTSTPALRLSPEQPAVNPAAARAAVVDLLIALGQDPGSEHLIDTPRRVAEVFAELLTPEPFAFTTFPNDEVYDGLVLVRDIAFTSLCQHHLLPFSGVAHIGYLPDERIVGLSKLARTVETFARQLQVQERLTEQIAGWLQDQLRPRGVGVVLQAEHQCMSLRGARARGSSTVTSVLLGGLRDDARTREEFLAQTRHS